MSPPHQQRRPGQPDPPRYARVLVTGSRAWTDTATIREQLAQVWHPRTVLVTGGCPTGADALCEACWQRWGGPVEQHRADWARHGRAAGPRRNQAMVAAGADLCLAFIHDNSPGASNTAGLAEAAGIPVRRYQQTTTSSGPSTATPRGGRQR